MRSSHERARMTSAELGPLRADPNIDDPNLLLGAKLLEEMASMPRSDLQKRRVRARLRAASASGFVPKERALRLAVALLLVAAASSAAVLHYLPAPATPTPSIVQKAAPLPEKTPSLPPLVVSSPPIQPAPEAEAEDKPVVRRAKARPLPSAAPHTRGAQNKAPQQDDADAELLLQALRARKSGDPSRVSELSEQYRRKQPDGALQEEALILSMESAVARREPRASALAREYLARFPNGRFRSQAQRALNLSPR